jgi:hypothetical protein
MANYDFGGSGLGGYLTFGINGGQGNIGIRGGVGGGLSASLDLKDSGCRPTGLGAVIGIDGSVGTGFIGGAAGGSIDSKQGDTVYIGGRAGWIGGTQTWSNNQPLYNPKWASSQSGGFTNYGASGFLGAGISYTGSGCP